MLPWCLHFKVYLGLASPGPLQLRALEPCIDAAVRGLHLSITAQCGEANDGWKLGQLHRRAGLQLRQMKSSSLCVSHILLAVPERNGSLQTKANKLDIWIWTLDFNHWVAAHWQVVKDFLTDTRRKQTKTKQTKTLKTVFVTFAFVTFNCVGVYFFTIF